MSEKKKEELLNNADLPLPELSVSDGELTYRVKNGGLYEFQRTAYCVNSNCEKAQPKVRVCING